MSLSVTVDHDRCVGAGVCEAIAPASFELGDDALAHPVEPPGDDESELLEARDACPSAAITVLRDGVPVE